MNLHILVNKIGTLTSYSELVSNCKIQPLRFIVDYLNGKKSEIWKVIRSDCSKFPKGTLNLQLDSINDSRAHLNDLTANRGIQIVWCCINDTEYTITASFLCRTHKYCRFFLQNQQG
jgi:hypothetical protein